VAKVRNVVSALCKKGFREDLKRDHRYYRLFYGGKKTLIYTKISHGETDLDPWHFSQVARQISLNNSQFREFITCPLSGEQYLLESAEFQPIR
jgi:hypothetical protein